jgi:hypothetical protein
MTVGAPTNRLPLLLGLLSAFACGAPEPGEGPEPGAVPAGEPAGEPAAASPAVFRDVTDRAGLDFTHRHGGTGRKYLPEIMGAGGAALDYDGDGWMDLYLVQSGPLPGAASPRAAGEPAPNRLYRNRGSGPSGLLGFEDVTAGSGAGLGGYGMGAVAADYDGDGDTDLYVVNLGPDALLRNNGDGTFTDVTVAAGISSPLWGSSAAFFDADRDGDLDLFVVNYLDFTLETHIDCGTPSRGILSYCHPDVYEMAPDVFFRNRGDGTFEEATTEAGLVDTTGKGLGVVVADLTGDGWPDVHVANDSTPNFLFRNRGDGRFQEAGLMLGVGYNEEGLTEAGMGTAVGDVDGDGYLDLFVTNLSAETNALYLGGPQFFTYQTRQAGLFSASYLPVGFGAELADLDNDGDPDLLVTNGHVIDNIEMIDDAQSFRQPSQLFWNDGRGRFTEAEAAALGELAEPRVGRGTISLDADNDGRLDVLITFNNDRARLFRNQLTGAGNWLGLDPRDRVGGIGALARLDSGGRSTLAVRTAGSSYQTSGDPRLRLGLGGATVAQRVELRWPDGARQSYLALPAGRDYRLTRPAAAPPR